MTNTYTDNSAYTTWDYGTVYSYTYATTGTSLLDIGVNEDYAYIRPWNETELNYFDRDANTRFSFAGDNNVPDDCIKVDKGSPTKAKYAIFYAVDRDPVIFCRTRREMRKEVHRLLKRKEVDPKSIRIFALIGGAKKIK
ncbi:MAG: hypothetical protein WC942_07525 [Clostridia bacterium]|jgi:hypothetical protein